MFEENNSKIRLKRPEWLKIKPPLGENYANIKRMTRAKALHTVCESARCPNIAECWGRGVATFMILGDVCSRDCKFCAIAAGKPQKPNPSEPESVAESIRAMGVSHAVITSVTRDDLPDGGAVHWAETIKTIKKLNPNVTVEVLIPDFKGDKKLLDIVLEAEPDVLNHNVETVPRLYKTVRPQADYARSLEVLRYAASQGFRTKSGLMVGLGERKEEIFSVFDDLRMRGTKIATIGQYLSPSKKHLPVDRYVEPKEFAEYKKYGKKIGFEFVASAPLVRSSYQAERFV